MAHQPARSIPATTSTDPVAARRGLPGSRRGSSSVTSTWALVRFFLRRDRLKLPGWVAGLGLYVAYVGSAVPGIAPTQTELEGVALLINSPVARMWVGPAYGMEAVTYERFFAAGYALYLYILAALMSILLVTRHTRGEEQSGRAELVRANVVGRHAPLTATMIVAVITNLLAGAVSTATLVGVGFATAGSLLIGAATTLTGLAFAGITAITVQLTENSRAAAGLAGGVLGLAFMVRALGDMMAVGGSTLSWFSPLSWGPQAAPYVLDRWWPLALLAGLTVVTIGLGYLLATHRDFGAGMLPARRGRTEASARLGTPIGLALRLQRNGLVGWGAVIVVFAFIDGAFGQAMLDAAGQMPPVLVDMFGGTSGLADGYLAFLAEFSGYLSVAYVVFAVQGLLVEENRGRAELILGTPTSRSAWAGSHLGVITVNVVLIMAAAGAFAGVGYAAVTGDWSAVGTSLVAHLNLVPAVTVVVGVCALLYGWAPRLLAPVGWTLVGAVFFFGVFAQLMDLPDWVLKISPLSHPAKMPVEAFEVAPVLVLLGLTVAGCLLGLVGLRQRQVVNKG